jgi:hypothetical protein
MHPLTLTIKSVPLALFLTSNPIPSAKGGIPLIVAHDGIAIFGFWPIVPEDK